MALNISEFTRPVTYYKNNPPEEIDFITLKDGELTAIEVKYTQGETKSSSEALKRGDIKHIIKIQKQPEQSDSVMTVLLLQDCHKLCELLGEPSVKTRYEKIHLDF